MYTYAYIHTHKHIHLYIFLSLILEQHKLSLNDIYKNSSYLLIYKK